MKYYIILLLSLGFGVVNAQSNISPGGGDAIDSGGSVAFTIGQVVYTKITNSDGSVLQGVQQAYEIFTVGSIESGRDFKLSVFPNPSSDIIILQVKDFKEEGLAYQFFDLKGKLLGNGSISSDETPLSLSYLPSGTYFLSVVYENKVLQTFKIIKNK